MKSVITIIKHQCLKIFFLILFTFCIAVAHAGAPPLVNYQGKLTDADGEPLAGSHKLSFSIYTAETDGIQVWGPQVFNNVSIIDGYFNVILRSDTSGRSISDAFASENAYLEITIGDGLPLPTRQRVLSAPYAIRSQYASHSRTEVPVGSISIYYGNPADLPDNWMVCDGSVVNDPESPLDSKILPDLREKFIRGEILSNLNIVDNLKEGGADSHTHPIQPHDHGIQSEGSHTHGGSTADGGVDHTHTYSGTTDIESDRTNRKKEGNTNTPNDYHTHNYSGTTSSASAYLHSHSISEDGSHNHTGKTDTTVLTTDETSHLPSFVALHFIIRIK